MSTIDRFRDNTVVAALAMGGDPAILAALAGGPHEGVRDAWGAADSDLTWDSGSPRDSATALLFVVADLLIGWEASAWGNVGGRYGYRLGAGGGLHADDWDALDAGTFPDGQTIGALDCPDALAMQGLHDYLKESAAHLAHVVQMGDMLSQIIDLYAGDDGRLYA